MADLDDFLATDRGIDAPLRLETGVIGTWTGGAHLVNVLGNNVDNPAYQVGASYTAGDVVLLAKYRTNYVILFKLTRL